jgi:hypothetical protein
MTVITNGRQWQFRAFFPFYNHLSVLGGQSYPLVDFLMVVYKLPIYNNLSAQIQGNRSQLSKVTVPSSDSYGSHRSS